MPETSVLSVQGIVKRYPGVTALDTINMDFFANEIHAICGENGAGKSTLIKILTGAVQPDEGRIFIEGTERKGYTPHEAMFNYGIAAIYQEFTLIPYLSVAENVFLGHEKLRKDGFLNIRKMNENTKEILNLLGVDLNPKAQVKTLSVAYQQLVEIAKAISHDAKILIMDEPSAPLTTVEVEILFSLVRNLRRRGVTVIYISHRLPEIFELSDRVSVFRDGRFISTFATAETNKKELIRAMVGRELNETFPRRSCSPSAEVLSVENMSAGGKLKNISFSLRAGEVLGFGGLVGAGRTELVRAVFGADPVTGGTVRVGGKRAVISHPIDAVRLGLGLIPEDRKQHGIITELSVKENVSYSSFDKVSRLKLISPKLLTRTAEKFRKLLHIACPNTDKKIKELSGGSQQKVVLARWLATDSTILFFDEPTRGIDVGAKQEIYELINQLAEEGKGIIFISSEMPELIGMSDRIIVMREGVITGTLSREEAS